MPRSFRRSIESLREGRLLRQHMKTPEIAPEQLLEELAQEGADIERLRPAVATLSETSDVFRALTEESQRLGEKQRRIIRVNLDRIKEKADTIARQKLDRLGRVFGIAQAPSTPIVAPSVPTEKGWTEKSWEWTKETAKGGWEWATDFSTPGKIAVRSALLIGAGYGAYRLLRWLFGKKEEGGAEKKEAKKGQWWKWFLWVPGVGLAGYGAYWAYTHWDNVRSWFKRGEQIAESTANAVAAAGKGAEKGISFAAKNAKESYAGALDPIEEVERRRQRGEFVERDPKTGEQKENSQEYKKARVLAYLKTGGLLLWDSGVYVWKGSEKILIDGGKTALDLWNELGNLLSGQETNFTEVIKLYIGTAVVYATSWGAIDFAHLWSELGTKGAALQSFQRTMLWPYEVYRKSGVKYGLAYLLRTPGSAVTRVEFEMFARKPAYLLKRAYYSRLWFARNWTEQHMISLFREWDVYHHMLETVRVKNAPVLKSAVDNRLLEIEGQMKRALEQYYRQSKAVPVFLEELMGHENIVRQIERGNVNIGNLRDKLKEASMSFESAATGETAEAASKTVTRPSPLANRPGVASRPPESSATAPSAGAPRTSPRMRGASSPVVPAEAPVSEGAVARFTAQHGDVGEAIEKAAQARKTPPPLPKAGGLSPASAVETAVEGAREIKTAEQLLGDLRTASAAKNEAEVTRLLSHPLLKQAADTGNAEAQSLLKVGTLAKAGKVLSVAGKVLGVAGAVFTFYESGRYIIVDRPELLEKLAQERDPAGRAVIEGELQAQPVRLGATSAGMVLTFTPLMPVGLAMVGTSEAGNILRGRVTESVSYLSQHADALQRRPAGAILREVARSQPGRLLYGEEMAAQPIGFIMKNETETLHRANTTVRMEAYRGYFQQVAALNVVPFTLETLPDKDVSTIRVDNFNHEQSSVFANAAERYIALSTANQYTLVSPEILREAESYGRQITAAWRLQLGGTSVEPLPALGSKALERRIALEVRQRETEIDGRLAALARGRSPEFKRYAAFMLLTSVAHDLALLEQRLLLTSHWSALRPTAWWHWASGQDFECAARGLFAENLRVVLAEELARGTWEAGDLSRAAGRLRKAIEGDPYTMATDAIRDENQSYYLAWGRDPGRLTVRGLLAMLSEQKE